MSRFRYTYAISVRPSGAQSPVCTPGNRRVRRAAEAECRALATETGHPVELWASRWTRVGREITGMAHRLVYRVAPDGSADRARDPEIGLDASALRRDREGAP